MPRIVRFYEAGGPEVLRIEEAPLEEPGKGEVRLKVEAFGLNRAEILFRQGLYLQQPKFPSRIGYEAAGVVDAVGPEVTGLKVGDRVSTIPAFMMGKYGAYGESSVFPAYAVARYPDSLSPVQGTAIWMQYLTAYGALVEFGKLTQADTVLITAASSSVGLAAIQITKSLGAKAIATSRGPGKKQALLDAGADHVIVTDEADVTKQVMELTSGRGARLIFDPVAGPFLEKLAGAAAPGGVIFEYGALSMAPTPFPLFDALGKGLNIRGYTLFLITADPHKLSRAKDFVYNRLAAGDLKPIIARTFPLAAVSAAQTYMESNQQIGKIVVTV